MKLLMMAASMREDSSNKKLIDTLGTLARKKDIEVDLYNINDNLIPLYHGDEEEKNGVPKGATNFATKMLSADGTVIASPEYNFSIPGVLKNLIDWVSRIRPMPFNQQNIFLTSASPSLVGGNRGLWATRIPLECCGAFVYPKMFSLASANQLLQESNIIEDHNTLDRLSNMFDEFIEYIKR